MKDAYDVASDWLGLVFALAGLALAVVLYRRPLQAWERHCVAIVLVVVSLAALAYRLRNLQA